METINHQLKKSKFYFPNWEVKYLFLGTFNPEGGQEVKYYYGREKNQTWNLISEVFSDEINPKNDDFFLKLKKYKIACVDIIDNVIAPTEKIELIKGKGYKDSEIINKKVLRNYNTPRINQLISTNENIKVFSTWGNGSSLKEWKTEVEKIKNITSLCSPSLAAKVPKGVQKFNYMLDCWKSRIILG